MRRIITNAVIICIAVFFTLSCTSKGPQGPAGSQGPTGKDGLACYTLQNNPDYNGTWDTYIDSFSNTINNGTINYMYAGVSGGGAIVARALIRFDLTPIVPSDVSIDSAYLTLYPYSPICSGDTTMTAYAVAGDSSGLWVEDTVTWELWSTPGGDFGPAPMSDPLVLSGSAIPACVTFKLNASVVQGWLSNPASNNGLILKAADESAGSGTFGFLTKEYGASIGSVSTNPLLTVYYRLP